jgi:hypothetical protein
LSAIFKAFDSTERGEGCAIPLNFVNNFSSVSAELLYELRENLGKVKADAALTHTMQRLQVELIGGLRRHKLHRWT